MVNHSEIRFDFFMSVIPIWMWFFWDVEMRILVDFKVKMVILEISADL